jgi:hypothetical protein
LGAGGAAARPSFEARGVPDATAAFAPPVARAAFEAVAAFGA